MEDKMEEKKLTKITFCDMYYQVIEQLSDVEAGKFIKRFCNFVFFHGKDIPSEDEQANIFWNLIAIYIQESIEDEKAGSTQQYQNRKTKQFTFYEYYANVFNVLSSDESAGILIKAICKYMFKNELTDDLPRNLQSTFYLFKNALDKSRARKENGIRGGKCHVRIKKEPVTLAKIRQDFPEIKGDLDENSDILKGVNLKELYKFIKENEEIRSLYMYNIVESFRRQVA